MVGRKAEKTLEREMNDYIHKDKMRLNNPPVGYAQHDLSDEPKKGYEYDPHLDPELQWTGKTERTSFEIPTVSLHIHETITPLVVIKNVKKCGGTVQKTLFETESLKDRKEKLEFYKHPRNWANRLIAGDSLLVMNSLLEKEGMAGKIQMVYIDPPYGIKYSSNFQPFIDKKDVKDKKDEDLTQEPEMIKAFRDTWELGIHSYLSYLRDRILLCRELLTDSGSIFVQISDENMHHVREICDEIFGSENYISTISYATTSGFASNTLSRAGDYVIWYSKSKDSMKYRPLFTQKEFGGDGGTAYKKIELKNGKRLSISDWEKETGVKFDYEKRPEGSKIFALDNIVSQGASSEPQPFEFEGRIYPPKSGSHWKASYPDGMDRLKTLRRIDATDNQLGYVRYFDDFPYMLINNLWKDTLGQNQYGDGGKKYVVQTSLNVVQRCMLMSTDPGDIVLDITCGSGTTAFIAEQWGRRWITCDTSRIAIALTKQRLITSLFDYYTLMHPEQDVSGGFVYKKVPHITLKSLANNETPQEEVIYDQPLEDRTKIRVTGPFTVEAIPAPVVNPVDSVNIPVNQTSKQSDWRDELKATGIIMRNGNRLEFNRVETLSGTKYLQAIAETKENVPRNAVICFADETRPLDSRMVRLALDEAEKKIRPSPQLIIFCAFQFGPEAAKEIEEIEWPGITMLKAQMNTDLLTEDLKKNRSSNQSFWAVGQPDIVCEKLKEGENSGKYVVKVKGYDYYDLKNGIQSGKPSDIAMWMLDVDYDGLSLNPTQIFFPMADSKDGWSKLAKTLKAEINQELIELYRGTESIPFDAKDSTKIAVKIIDNRGVESMKVMDIEG